VLITALDSAGEPRVSLRIFIDHFRNSVPCCQYWGGAMPVILARSTLLAKGGDGCLC
jgi:hypothetical protein